MPASKHLVIVGGGFAGLNAGLALRDAPVNVTLVDRRNFHLFQPLLYQVATGALSPGDICAPLRHIFGATRNIRVLLGEVIDFDVAGRRVLLRDGELAYDFLMLAPGAESSYFGHDDWRQKAPGLKSVEEATNIRGRIFRAFESAERVTDPSERADYLRFVVVGGGPTGVEMAGAIAEIAHDTLRDSFRSFRSEEAEVLLVEGGPRLLSQFPPDLSEKAETSLIRLGVRSRTGVKVVEIDDKGVDIETSEGCQRIGSRTVIWAAGVRASSLGRILAERTGMQVDRGGRLTVAPDLSLPGHPEIFIAGDLARVEQNGATLPGMAPVAIQQGRYIGKAIRERVEGRDVKPFHFFDKGTMATIGRNAAVVDLRGLHFSGFFAWLTWLFVHLLYIVGFRNRVVIALQWGFQYLTFNRGARLITGEDPTCAPK